MVSFPILWCLTAHFPVKFRKCDMLYYHDTVKKESGSVTCHGGALGERRYSFYHFLTSALEGDEWSGSRPGRALPAGKEPPGTHCTGGLVGPRAGLDAEVRGKTLCHCRGSNPGRPVRSQILYSLSYLGTIRTIYFRLRLSTIL
jgi:hypothetical protein